MSENNKGTQKEEIKSYISENNTTTPKKSNFGIYAISVSVLLGLGVLGSTIYVKNNQSKDNSPKVETVSDSKFDNQFADIVLPNEYKSIETKVVDYSQEPFSDNYKLDSSHLNYLNVDGAKELLSKEGKSIIYIGRPNCPYCHLYRQVQDVALKELDMDIYSIDSIYAKYEKELINMVSDDFGVDGVPAILVIENGKVINNMSDELGGDMFENKDLVKQWFVENSK